MHAREPWPGFLRAMIRIAVHSFGGPVAQIGVVHEELVERRAWIDEATFARLLSFANVLPGPEALELVIHVGYLRRGIPGGVVAGLLFIAPGIVSLTLLGWLYLEYGSTHVVSMIQWAIRPVAVALVVAAALRLSRKLLHTVPAFAIATVTLLASHYFGLPFVLILIAGAILGVAIPQSKELPVRHSTLAAIGLIIAAITIGAVARPQHDPSPPLSNVAPFAPPTLGDIALLNLKTALVTFGGAYTALPYLREQVVDRLRWMPDGAMLDALALGETTPGPLISIGVFVSYLAGGLPGALVGAFFLFLPSFVLVLSLARFFDRIVAVPGIVRTLEGVLATTIGLILALIIDVVGGIAAIGPALIAAAAFSAVTFLRASPVLVVLFATIGAVLIALL